MPTYEYVCKKCGHELEAFQSMKDAPLKKCPECGKLSLKRLIGSGAGLIFKGSGFYITDYKKSSASGSPEASKSKPAETKGTESKGSESKPAESKPAAKSAAK